MWGPHLENPKEPVLGKSQNACCNWMYEKTTPIGSMEEIRKKTRWNGKYPILYDGF